MNADALRQTVAGLMPGLRADLERLVRLPSVSFEGFPEEPLKLAGSAVAELLQKAGLPEVRMIDIARAPQAVFAARPAQPGAPTVLLYAHYDVQPAGAASAWAIPPFAPTERAGRLYGRGAADDKSGIIMHAGALLALGADCPVGVKVLIEGQEENGQGGIEAFVKANAELLKADVIVVSDLGNYSLGVPTLTTSLRGMAALDVEIGTLEGAVHSGMFGGPAPDALIALMRMVATLHDPDGTVAVKGLDVVDHVGAPYDEAAYRNDAGMLPGVHLIGAGSIADRLYGRPSINVIGIDAPVVEGAASALIPKARARVSVRLAPNQDPAEAQGAVAKHLEAAAPWHVKVKITPGGVGQGFLARTDGPAYAAATGALAAAFKKEVVHYGEGGSIPLVAAFLEAQPAAEMILWGCEEPQCKIHAPNESVDLAEVERMTLAEALFIAELAGAE
ncbi:MAG: dipeptidase [Actinobacteria bacterium]|nr:dipeptidase [Actinomycetota bacterium]